MCCNAMSFCTVSYYLVMYRMIIYNDVICHAHIMSTYTYTLIHTYSRTNIPVGCS